MEHIIDTFTNGLKNLHKNPVIFWPYILFTILVSIASLIWAGALVIFLFIPILEGGLIDWTSAAISSAAFLLFSMLLTAYVSAGTIGMTKNAISTGITKFGDCFTYGNKYFVRVFIASILVALLQLIALIFWTPMIYVFNTSGYTFSMFIEILFSTPEALISLLTSLAIWGIIGFLLNLIYSIIISVLFYFVLYAIVIDNCGIVASFKKSYEMLRQNFWKVLIFIIAVYVIVVGITSIISSVSSILSVFSPISAGSLALSILISLLQLFVSLILAVVSIYLTVATFVWETRFYMVVNGHEIAEIETKEKEDLLTNNF